MVIKLLFKVIVTQKLTSVTVIECFILISCRKMTRQVVCKILLIFKSTNIILFNEQKCNFISADLIFQFLVKLIGPLN